MNKIKHISGTGVPLVGDDIDTDRIIPARFLRCVTFEGLGNHAFEDDRASTAGKHPFDLPQYRDANILVVNNNFGCGSSREHAPQALAKWGIEAIVGESFAEIFLGNCVAIGVPCVVATSEAVEQIQAILKEKPQAAMTLDLETMQVTCDELSVPVKMNQGSRQMFVEGTWDNCGQLTANVNDIRATASKLPYLHWQGV